MWVELHPDGAPPSSRELHTAVYDPIGDRMVVFGGLDGANALNDVWALSLAGVTFHIILRPRFTFVSVTEARTWRSAA